MIEKLNELYVLFKNLAASNPILAGAFSLYGLGVVTYLVRDIPSRIWRFFEKQVTTTMTVNNSDSVYYFLLKWLSEKKMHSFVRSLSLGKANRNDVGTIITMGYGRQWIFFERHLISINRVKEDANNTLEQKEQIYLTVYSRNHKIFEKLFEHIMEPDADADQFLSIFKYRSDYWQYATQQFYRDIDTVSLPKENKDKILKHIETFYNEKEWFVKHGIPWRTGILLYGPPGTGKTSLAEALCAKFDCNLYILDLGTCMGSSIEGALSSVPRGNICLIEDIDTEIPESRTSSENPPKLKGTVGDLQQAIAQINGATPTPMNSLADSMKPSIGVILNAIDGANSGEGRILIATTNHVERLDPALIREGRFDLKIEIGYMKDTELYAYMERFYGEIPSLRSWHILPEIAPCKVQKLVFDNRNEPFNVLREIATFESDVVLEPLKVVGNTNKLFDLKDDLEYNNNYEDTDR